MSPDTPLLHDEAREVIKGAMEHYSGDDRHVAVFAAMRTEASWNDLQVRLSRASIASSPTRIKQMTSAVETAIKEELRTYIK
ncbi:hypothetical protein [Salinibacter ruber]|uniref:hypothetical protein n=1 Tax=Salinibacter ruber TaxID=146919 RepID=UPI0020743BF5|nr:hypothetical protein [Salinibacter ruber]